MDNWFVLSLNVYFQLEDARVFRPPVHAGPLTSRLEHMSRIESREAQQLMQGGLGRADGNNYDGVISPDLMEIPLTFDFARLQQVSSSHFACWVTLWRSHTFPLDPALYGLCKCLSNQNHFVLRQACKIYLAVATFSTVSESSCLLQLSRFSASWGARREAEVDRSLRLLARRREMAETQVKLEAVARQQERLGREEQLQVADEQREAGKREARAGVLAGLKRDMEEAKTR